MRIGEATPTKGKNNLVMIVIILFAILIGAVVSSGFTSGKAAEMIKVFSEEEIESTVPLEEFLINLDPGESATKNFLKIELSLYSTKEGADVLLNANVAKVRDTIISVLRMKNVNNVFKEDDKLVLKKELIEAVNKKLDTDVVEDIFITNIVTQ